MVGTIGKTEQNGSHFVNHWKTEHHWKTEQTATIQIPDVFSITTATVLLFLDVA